MNNIKLIGLIAILLIINYFKLKQSSVVSLSKNSKFNNIVKNKLQDLVKKYGEPNRVETTNNGNNLYKATWLNIENCDEIIIYENIFKKYHPHKAIVFVIARKLMHIPDHLFGPLKYASETINIEQVQTNKELSDKYYNSGVKEQAMVSGSCASIIISVITLNFVMDMVKKYKSNAINIDTLMKEFRDEYNRRVHEYLIGNEFNLPWFDHKKSVEYKVLVPNTRRMKNPPIKKGSKIIF